MSRESDGADLSAGLTQSRLDGGVNVPVVYAGAGTEAWYPCPGPHPIRGHSWRDSDE